MQDEADGDWNDRIAALQRAARMERSQVLLQLLMGLFRRCRATKGDTVTWAPPRRPALGEGR